MITRKQQRELEKRGVHFVDHQNFLKGEDCLGMKPLWKNDTVFTCIDYIARQVASLSIKLFDYTDNKKTSLYNGLTRMINDSPNPQQTRYDFIYQLVFEMYVNGAVYGVPSFKRNDGKELLESIELSQGLTYKNGKYFLDGKPYDTSEILIFKDNYAEISPASLIKEIVVNLALTDKTKETFYSGAYMPNMIVAVDSDSDMWNEEESDVADMTLNNPIEKSTLDNLISKFFKPKEGDPIVVPTDKFIIEQIKPMSMKDIALNESIEIDKKRIANIFGVPLYVVGIGAYNKDEQINFINSKIRPLTVMIEKEMTKKLLRSQNMAFSFNLNSLLRGDTQERTTLYLAMARVGAISPNEIREQEGYDFIEGLDEPILIGGGVPEKATEIGLKGGDE